LSCWSLEKVPVPVLRADWFDWTLRAPNGLFGSVHLFYASGRVAEGTHMQMLQSFKTKEGSHAEWAGQEVGTE
jgi:hypothetical protein